ncbi:MAG: extensin family protein [Polyangiaceae bacterium]
MLRSMTRVFGLGWSGVLTFGLGWSGVLTFGLGWSGVLTFGCAATRTSDPVHSDVEAGVASAGSHAARTALRTEQRATAPSAPAPSSSVEVSSSGTRVNAEADAGASESKPSAIAGANDTPTANLDPTDDAIVGPPEPIEDCHARLQAAQVSFRSATLPIKIQRRQVCGAPQAVVYRRGPEGIAFSPTPIVSCPLALGLARFEGLVQRLSLEYFGVRVKRIVQGGTYNCRSMARFNLVSEHSYANAIDLYGFVLENGKSIQVLRDFGATDRPPKGKEGAFLRDLARAAYDEAVFSVVVTRFFDELHRDHIHVDMAHYRTDGTRP